MAVQHYDRIGVTLVMNGAAGAPARYLLCHGYISEGSTAGKSYEKNRKRARALSGQSALIMLPDL
jgi:hypothetical protein